MLMSRQHPHDHRPRPATRRSLTFSTIAPPLLRCRRSNFAAVAVVVLCILCLGARADCANGENHIVVIKQMHFDPPQTTVKPGDTVEWKNEDIFSHTVTA